MSWKSVSSCMFLTFTKSKILKYSEKVWVHGHSCSLYIPIRNIQGLTPSHFWHFLAPFVKKCMSLYVSGPLTTDQEHTRTGTFWWKGVSPCTFLANSYRLREYTRTHTFSLNIWWKGVTPCMFLPHTICGGTDVKGKIIPKCFSGKFKKNKGSKPGGFLRNLPGNKEYFLEN